MRIDGHGITVVLPAGWEGAILRRDPPPGPPTRQAGPAIAETMPEADHGSITEVEHPVTHLANFALPSERGDFGSGAVETMRSGDVLVCLVEYDPGDAGRGVFRLEGVPRVQTDQFSPSAMQRTIAGMSGTQAFFSESGRAFCLYVVLGSHADRRLLVPQVNDLLATLRIALR